MISQSRNNYPSKKKINNNEEMREPEKLFQCGINSILKTFENNHTYYISQINEQKIIINKLTNKLELTNQELKMRRKEINYYKIQNKKLQNVNETLILMVKNMKGQIPNKLDISNLKNEEQFETKVKSNGISNLNVKCDIMNEDNDLQTIKYENKIRLFDSFDKDKKNIETERPNNNNKYNDDIHIIKSLSTNNLIKNEKEISKFNDSYKKINNGSFTDQYNEIKAKEMKHFLKKCGIALDKNIFDKIVNIFQEYKDGFITEKGFVKKMRHYLKNKSELMKLFEKIIS